MKEEEFYYGKFDKSLKFIGIGIAIGAVIIVVLVFGYNLRPSGVSVGLVQFDLLTNTPAPTSVQIRLQPENTQPIPTTITQSRQITADGLLAEIISRGIIVISTDPNYEPQSFLNTNGKRPANTKCAANMLTSFEMQGFDIDVANSIGIALGVETCFVTPTWDLITSGNWADRWDISVGSMTITPERQKVLTFSTPYYYTADSSGAVQELAIAIDKSHSLLINSLVERISQIINDMHNDGTLSSLSNKWFGKDLTKKHKILRSKLSRPCSRRFFDAKFD